MLAAGTGSTLWSSSSSYIVFSDCFWVAFSFVDTGCSTSGARGQREFKISENILWLRQEILIPGSLDFCRCSCLADSIFTPLITSSRLPITRPSIKCCRLSTVFALGWASNTTLPTDLPVTLPSPKDYAPASHLSAKIDLYHLAILLTLLWFDYLKLLMISLSDHVHLDTTSPLVKPQRKTEFSSKLETEKYFREELSRSEMKLGNDTKIVVNWSCSTLAECEKYAKRRFTPDWTYHLSSTSSSSLRKEGIIWEKWLKLCSKFYGRRREKC